MARKAKVTECCGLLAETRLALSALRLEELETLAARAEKMLEAATAPAADAPRGLEPSPAERSRAIKEHRLLGSLLADTAKNLEVLERLRGGSSRPRNTGEMDSRWVR